MPKQWFLKSSFPGLAFSAAFLVLYGYAQYAGNGISPDKAAVLYAYGPVAWALAVAFFGAGVGSSVLQLQARARRASGSGGSGGIAVLGEPFLDRRGRRRFLALFGLYFLVFSWASSILVIRPGQDFTASYGVQVPSVETIICCGPVGTVPSYTVYAMQGLGLLLIPANVFLALSVSLLAALSLSVSLTSFATWRATSQGAGSAGIAGAIGFVASCPTCAGQVLLGALLGPGSTAVALALAPWQLEFALTAIGVLLLTLWAQIRWIAKSRRPCSVEAVPQATTRTS